MAIQKSRRLLPIHSTFGISATRSSSQSCCEGAHLDDQSTFFVVLRIIGSQSLHQDGRRPHIGRVSECLARCRSSTCLLTFANGSPRQVFSSMQKVNQNVSNCWLAVSLGQTRVRPNPLQGPPGLFLVTMLVYLPIWPTNVALTGTSSMSRLHLPEVLNSPARFLLG